MLVARYREQRLETSLFCGNQIGWADDKKFISQLRAFGTWIESVHLVAIVLSVIVRGER